MTIACEETSANLLAVWKTVGSPSLTPDSADARASAPILSSDILSTFIVFLAVSTAVLHRCTSAADAAAAF